MVVTIHLASIYAKHCTKAYLASQSVQPILNFFNCSAHPELEEANRLALVECYATDNNILSPNPFCNAHTKLGHRSVRSLQELVDRKLVANLDPNSIPTIEVHSSTRCLPCAQAKMTATPFAAKVHDTRRAKSELDRVSVDTMSFPIKSFNNEATYWTTAVDEYSGYCWGFPHAKKSDINDILIDFIRQCPVHRVARSSGHNHYLTRPQDAPMTCR